MATKLKTTIYDFVVGGRTFKVANDSADTLLAGSLQVEHTWEPWQLLLYSRLVRDGSICLDIGGNIGTSALAMSHYAGSGQVYSFEPVAGTYDLLRNNLITNGAKNVVPVNLGLSDATGQAQIVVDRVLLGNAHQIKTDLVLDPDTQYVETFQTERLDDWLAANRLDTVDLVKADVEGFELEVIAGGHQFFTASADTVAIFEFAIHAQRVAAGVMFPEPPKDFLFYQKLSELYPFIFLIGRDSRLYRSHSYAHLRAMMMFGHLVDDLFCCRVVPDAVKDLIAPACLWPKHLQSPAMYNGAQLAIALGRGDDGWMLGGRHPHEGSSAAFVVSGNDGGTLTLNVNELHKGAHDLQAAPVMITVGAHVSFVDACSGPHIVDVPLMGAADVVFVETQYWIDAGGYFGNPTDTRLIGARVMLPGFDT